MVLALKLGFPCSRSVWCFHAVNSTVPKFNSKNLRMSLKRPRSSSPASNAGKLEDSVSVGVSKPKKNASKASIRRSGVLEDDFASIEKMTLQEMKSRLRSTGVPAKGANPELASAVKSCMNSQTEGEEKPTIVQAYSKRKAKGLSKSDIEITNNASEICGGKRTKRQVKQSSDSSINIKSLHQKTEQELIVDSTEMEGKKSIKAKKRISSSITTTNTKANVNDDLPVVEPWTVLTHKKPQKGWTAYNPRSMRPPPIAAGTPHIKLMSWNVNGLRALLKLESSPAFFQLAQREGFDVLCLQETKLQAKDVDAIRRSLLEGYENSYWTCSVSKLGYSGTAIISRIKPHSVRYGLGISDHDSEGRLVTVEFDDFYLLCGYVPNSGDGLRRLSYRTTQWDPSLSNYMKDLEQSKPVILTGDLNCAHQEIDIYNPAGNKRSAGFTDEERKSFQTNFLERGFVDTFRKQHPDVVGYTYWGYRHGGRRTNKGWRLDYFLASESITNQVYDSYILPDVAGSDHSPIGLVLKL